MIGKFSTRQDAEIAVEHLVQELRISRTDIFIRASGPTDSAGIKAAGSQVASGRSGESGLKDEIEVSVDCHDLDPQRVGAAMKGIGAIRIRLR